MSKMILGITGSIAAYRATEIVSQLKGDYDITPVMTDSAAKFISPITMQTVTGNKVYNKTFDEEDTKVSHIDVVKESDIILIAPATANFISKMAYGICDDMLSTMVVVGHNKRIIVAPAMNTNMYENPIIQENIKKLKSFGVEFIEPKESLLACGDYGKGALANIEDIVKVVKEGK